MGRVPPTAPSEDGMNRGIPVQHAGIPVQQTGVPVGSFTPQDYQANIVNQHVGSSWNTGLFDCHEDQTNAVMTAFFPCVTFGQIAEVVDEGEMTCPLGSFIYLLMMPALCSQWVMGSKYRAKIRSRYGLVEAPYSDIVSHVFCSCCSLCQEYRELKTRNLDPSLAKKIK
ncbi:PREDICTED: protein PLANT CADMIUM RESISTANCE 8 isoform X2 [Tarenaya hassleriana]|uniref:protein PLANT CADMIUM RESISTANCE 8 isoform X2 n=1 Tax=Tarenaya hassleriana TaxID=28532 RepID=UPI00053C1937|nr:PREDICTED: protein PLANT CADMIUM RESISTANCE 8 isoform X2 [Tarenaya hassleriana]